MDLLVRKMVEVGTQDFGDLSSLLGQITTSIQTSQSQQKAVFKIKFAALILFLLLSTLWLVNSTLKRLYGLEMP